MKKIESWSQDVANMELMIENQAFNQHYYIINSSNIVHTNSVKSRLRNCQGVIL